MRTLFFLLLVGGLSCRNEKAADQEPSQTEPAFIYANNLASDGCEEFVRLDHGNPSTDVMYKPTVTSLPILQNALRTLPTGTGSLEHPVIIRFRETGNQVSLQCGWGSRPTIGEIEILSIDKR
ncbi:hypothetical protein [Spirosoma agri]|uniref:Lipoprotein n=1 Tax=Spirosoma agri TaxID=1987381 RepID=A0A6M0IH46_9BACT|nr:hypothetical protein [Spirosoma agri]NEU67600.1 hypothetical protein [Spirosoma agri]